MDYALKNWAVSSWGYTIEYIDRHSLLFIFPFLLPKLNLVTQLRYKKHELPRSDSPFQTTS